MAAPDWLTKDFLQKCLQSQEEHPIAVTRYTIGPPVVPDGNNYGSQLFRVMIDYSTEDSENSVSLIIKGPLPLIEKLFNDTSVYEKEHHYYSKFISETYKYSKHEIVPKHYPSPNPYCLVLEDLKASGYVMVNRCNFLDLEHCELYIKSSAKLHALSVAVHRENHAMIESIVNNSQTVTDTFNKFTKLMIEGGLRCMAAYLEDKPDYKEYLDVIKEVGRNEKLWKMYQEMETNLKNKPLKALIQVDPWCTNMMFKYNTEGKVESIKILDFQNLAFTSPLTELVTFVTNCPNMNVRETKLNELYILYCNTLNDNLADFGCSERLKFEEIKAEIVNMAPLVLFIICGLIPILLAEGAADLNEYFSGNILNDPVRESPIYKLYQSATFNRYYPQILDIIAKEGVFDTIKEKIR